MGTMYADLGLLILRVVAGSVVLAHGLQKLGYLGGYGFDGTAGFINTLGFRPSRPWTAAVVVAEVVGSALLILGLGGPIGPGIVAADLLVALVVVHVPKGWWNANGGVEYVAVIAASALAVALIGAGAYSVDALLNLTYATWLVPAWLGLMALGVIGALVSRRIGATEAAASS
jgi:putative oxidoreductase